MLTNDPFEDVLRVINEQLLGQVPLACDVKQRLTASGLSTNAGLGDIYGWLSKCQKQEAPKVSEAHICVFASSYTGGADPKEVSDFIGAAAKGMAPVNRFCVDHGIGLRVLEMAPEIPHQVGDSWTEIDCTRAVAFGMEAAAAGGDLLGVSDIAPGNVPGKLALIASCDPELGADWLRSLHGCDDINDVAIDVFEEHSNARVKPLEALRLLGGREVAGCLGAFIAARSKNLPVSIDGWAAMSAFAVLKAINVSVTDHIRLASCHNRLQEQAASALGIQPIVGTYIDAGSGCGTALSVSVFKAAIDTVRTT